MPVYEYFCEECEKTFTKILSLHEYEEGKVFCPFCGSERVDQHVSIFTAVTSRKS